MEKIVLNVSNINKFIQNAIELLNNNGVREPFYYLHISKYNKPAIKYLDSRGYKKTIGDTVIYEINRQCI